MEKVILQNEIVHMIKMQNDENNKCIKLLDVYEDDEFVHLVMEYCKCGSLQQLLWDNENGKPLSGQFLSEALIKRIVR